MLSHLKQHRCRHLLRHRRKASYNRLFICLSEQLVQSPCQFTWSLHQFCKRTFILTVSKVKLNLSRKCLYLPVISQLVKCIYRPVICQSISAAVKLRRMDPLSNPDPSLLISQHVLLYIRTARQKLHDHPSLSAWKASVSSILRKTHIAITHGSHKSQHISCSLYILPELTDICQRLLLQIERGDVRSILLVWYIIRQLHILSLE